MSIVNDYVNIRMTELIGEKECAPVGEYVEIISEEVKEKFNVQCLYENCGGFESCGYDIICHAISYINECGILEMQSFTEEHY